MNEQSIATCEERHAVLGMDPFTPIEPEVDPEARILHFVRPTASVDRALHELNQAMMNLRRASDAMPKDHPLHDRVENYLYEGVVLASLLPGKRDESDLRAFLGMSERPQ